MGGAKELLQEIEDIERRMADPATVETLGEDLGSMQRARVQMIGRLNAMSEEHRPVTTHSQRDAFRTAAHEAGGSLLGLGGDNSATPHLMREGEVVDEDHLADVAALYGPEAAANLAAATNELATIESIKSDSLSGRLAGDAGGLRPGEDPVDYAHRTTAR